MSFIAVGSAAIVAGGAIAASSIQSSAAKKAARTQVESGDAAIDLQREQYQQQRQDLAPWRQAGIRGLRQFETLAGQGPPEMAPFRGPRALDPSQFAFTEQFQAPTEADLLQDPSYRFRVAEGQRALERGASARGGLLSGGTLRGLERYAQDYASTEYGNVYGREFGEHQQRLTENQLRYGRALTQNESAYERALQQYQTNFNAGLTEWQAQLQPFQTLAYGGQAASGTLAQLGGQYASNTGDILQGQANAMAAGQVGSANAISQGLGSLSGILGQAAQNYYLGVQQGPQYPQQQQSFTQGPGSLPFG